MKSNLIVYVGRIKQYELLTKKIKIDFSNTLNELSWASKLIKNEINYSDSRFKILITPKLIGLSEHS